MEEELIYKPSNRDMSISKSMPRKSKYKVARYNNHKEVKEYQHKWVNKRNTPHY